MSKTHNAGIVTAYGAAVRGGYTGTYEEFCAQQAQYAENARQMEQAVSDVRQIKTSVESAVSEAETHANNAGASATNASNSAASASNSADSASQSATSAQASATNASNSAASASQFADNASNSANSASQSATSAQTSATNASASEQSARQAAETAQDILDSVQSEVNTQISRVQAESNTQIGRVQAEGNTQIGRVQAKGDEIIVSLPEDFTEIQQEIRELNGSLGNVKADLADVTKQLISDKRTVDKVPYKYRASASGKSDRAYDMIVGGTVCFNQLCNGTSVDTVSGRKYLTKTGGKWSVVTGAGTAITGLTSGTDMVMDLTAMFGTEIADHVYNLEQSQAGAGVALFRAMFLNNYYPFNPGELISVAGLSAHEAVGFNQWDEVYEAYGTSQIRSKNRIHLLPGITYYAKTPSVGISLYFKAQIDDAPNVGSISVTNNTFTVPANANYAVLYSNAGYGTVYKNDICINISSDKNGKYEPYNKTVYPLDSSLTLRGVPVLKDGKIEFNGDTYEADGTVTRRYGIVDLGTLDWVYSASPNEGFYCDNIGAKIPQTTAQKFVGICPIYANRPYNEVFAKTYDKSIAVRTNGGLRIYDSAYTDATTFKAAMSGVMLVYELATPTTEETTPYTNPQVVSPYGTEEYISESVCPVGHITEYPDNLRAKIDGLPWDLSMIAPVETAYTATRNYTTGQLLIVDNTLYKVTANIANGGTIAVGTNVVATTLSEVIASLS